MEGSIRLVLLEPGPETRDQYGQVFPGVPIQHIAWATRSDRGGSEGLQADTQVGQWETVFRVRQIGLATVSHKWSVEDERGVIWDIERVSQVPQPRDRWFLLYCVARS